MRAGGPTEPVAFHFPGDDLFAPLLRPHGLPIGNLTSQIWANAVLTPVDHLLGSGLGLGSFVRYCDDVLVYAEDRSRLEDAWRRVRDLADRLRLGCIQTSAGCTGRRSGWGSWSSCWSVTGDASRYI